MADLKSRMHDVPGASGMTMTMDAGQMVYTINGQNFAFDAAASDATIESTIRAGLSMLPPVAFVTDAAPAASAATPPDASPAPVAEVAAPAPSVAPAPAKAAPAASAPIVAAHTVREMLQQHSASSGNQHAAHLANLAMAFQRQNEMVAAAIGAVTSKIEQQTSDFQDVMSQFTNMLGDL